MKENVSDAFWNEWSQSFSSLPSFGEQFEHYTTDAMKVQQEVFERLKEDLHVIQKDMMHYKTQMQANYGDYQKQFHDAPFTEPLQEWPDKWRHLSEHMHKAAVHPAEISLALLSQKNNHFEQMWPQLMKQNEQHRLDVQTQMREFLRDTKKLQRKFSNMRKDTKNC